MAGGEKERGQSDDLRGVVTVVVAKESDFYLDCGDCRGTKRE